jgi:dTDP-4-dehydrorhamnose 3,5-epimerase-like enzyme
LSPEESNDAERIEGTLIRKAVGMFVMIDLPTRSDERGSLTVAEDVLPFDVRRLYWIYGAGGHTRGGHRHRQTRQALLAIHGEVVVHMNDGEQTEDVLLSTPDRFLLVEPKDWHRMTFREDAILLVAASHGYDSADYIHESYPSRP